MSAVWKSAASGAAIGGYDRVKAVIMAGGRGTRLRPLTSEQPKPMIPIANVPCMEHIINLLKNHGFFEIVVTLQFMGGEIRDYFGDGSKFGVEISYSTEDEPAGTAGSVKLAEERLALSGDESFLVISGDALTDADLTSLVRYHEERRSEATMVLKSVENPLDFGVVITAEDGAVTRFFEKPAWGQVFSDTVNTGIYLLGASALGEIPDPLVHGESDFSKEVFPGLLASGAALYGYVTDAYWQDIGTLDQYTTAQRDVLGGLVAGIRPPGTRLRGNIYVGQRSRLDDESLEGPLVIGDGVRIDEGAVIGPYNVLGANVVVCSGARVERSVVADGSYIGEGAEVVDAVIGRSCYVQARARIMERSFLGDDVIVGEGATVSPDVKVYPHKTIEDGANVSQSLIYETMGLRTVFRGGRVAGKFNVDFTPEFVVRLASSFGATLDVGSTVTVGRDASSVAQVSKRAMTAALLSSGINVRDLRAAHAGVVRHDVLAGKASAGAHLRAGEDPDDAEILFFTSDATPLSEADEREIEKHLLREEFRRAHGGDIGELIYPARAVEQYVERLERATRSSDDSSDFSTEPTIVVDFSGGVANLVASRAFSRLGVNAVVVSGFSNANSVGANRTGSISGDALEERLERVGRIAPTVGAAFGCVVGATGEYVHFVDDLGEPVPPDVMLACVLERMRPSRAVLPVNLSSVYREIVESGGGTVTESRSGLVNVAIRASEEDADLGALDDGHFVFPSFLAASDCFIIISCFLKFFAGENLSRLSRTWMSDPRYGRGSIGNVLWERLECPWSAKGRVMRVLAEEFGGDPDAALTDGIKLKSEDGWVLMLPDPDDPFFHVYSEVSPPDRAFSTPRSSVPAPEIRATSMSAKRGESVSDHLALVKSLVRGAAW